MSIVKSKHSSNFTVLKNEVFNCGLSLEAIGLLAKLLSLPHDWVIHKMELYKKLGIGREKLDRIFSELQDAGYIISIQEFGEGGKFSYNHIVYDTPFNGENPLSEEPLSGNPLTANPQLLNKEGTKETITKERKTIYEMPDFKEFLSYAKTLKPYKPELDFSIQAKYNSWVENKWKDGFGKSIKNWKSKLQNTIVHLKPVYNNNSAPNDIKYPDLNNIPQD